MPIEQFSSGSRRTSAGDTVPPGSGVPGEKPWRSFAKAISWRVLGTLDTFFLSFFVIKYLGPVFGLVEEHSNVDIAATASLIAFTEIATKIFIYTVHERLWNKIGWGVVAARMLRIMSRWRRYDPARRELMRTQLERVLAAKTLSRDVYEIASKSLQGD